MKLKDLVGKKYKSLLASVLALGVIFPMAALGGSEILAAGNPEFNNMSNDYPTLMVANRTQNASSYGSTTSVNAGDRLAFRVYIHNTVVDSTAEETTVNASISSGYSTSHTVSAIVSARNADPANGSVSVTSDENVELQFLSGTTQRFWFVDGVMQSEIVSDDVLTDGILLGGVNGCWEYVQYVVFQADVVAKNTPPQLTIDKQVMNVTNSTSYSNEVSAEENDKVRFRINVANESGDEATGLVLLDNLPSNLEYVDGSTKVDGSSKSDGIIDNGVNLDNLSAGESVSVVFDATVETNSEVRLENVATITAENADSVNDNAYVNVQGGSENPDLAITKTVAEGKNGTDYQERVETENDDYVHFHIVVENNGEDRANEVVVLDDMDSRLEYVDGTLEVDGDDRDNDADDFFDNGINIGYLDTNEDVVITYSAQVNTNSEVDLENEATATADNADSVRDSAYVENAGSGDDESYLYISKSVDQDEVQPGEEVEYTIVVRNTGDGDATNVRITDDLPSRVRYISSSIDVNVDGNGDVEDDDLFGDGVIIDVLEPDDEVTITYDARVDSDAADGARLVNTAVARDDEGDRAEDEATITVANDGYLQLTKDVDKSNAKAGDTLTYTITVENTGDGDATNLVIIDDLPNYVSYIDGSMDINGDNVRDYDEQDLFESRGIRVSKLSQGDEIEIVFKAKISSSVSNNTTLENLAEVEADNGLNDEDVATTFVGSGGNNPNIDIVKLVRNDTTGGSYSSSNTAKPSDVLEYKITLTNTGNTRLTNVRAQDVLPSDISYLGGTVKVWYNNSELSGDYNGITGSGVTLPDMNVGDVVTITFKAKASSSVSGSRTNTINVTSNLANDTASATTRFEGTTTQTTTRNLPDSGPNISFGFLLFSGMGALTWFIREKYLLGQML